MKEIVNETFITTVDNPYNPLTQFDDWFLFDMEKGYNTTNLINRIIQSDYETNVETESNEEIISEVLERIVSLFPNLYKIVSSDIEEETIDISITNE